MTFNECVKEGGVFVEDDIYQKSIASGILPVGRVLVCLGDERPLMFLVDTGRILTLIQMSDAAIMTWYGNSIPWRKVDFNEYRCYNIHLKLHIGMTDVYF